MAAEQLEHDVVGLDAVDHEREPSGGRQRDLSLEDPNLPISIDRAPEIEPTFADGAVDVGTLFKLALYRFQGCVICAGVGVLEREGMNSGRDMQFESGKLRPHRLKMHIKRIGIDRLCGRDKNRANSGLNGLVEANSARGGTPVTR